MIERRTGDRRGRSISLESLPTGSVVYVGRESFRMETVDLGDDGLQGIVQAMPAVTTAPYGIDARGEGSVIIDLDAGRDLDRAVSSASWRAPALDSLFGSQDEITMLAAPTGQATLPAPAALELSRAAIAAMMGLVFLGGLATASLVLQPRAAERSPVIAAAPVVVATPVEITAKSEPTAEPVAAAEPQPEAEPEPATVAEPTTIQVAAPVRIRAERKAPRVVAPPATVAVQAPAAPWVDPFAD